MATTAAVTLEAIRAEVPQHEAKIAKLKSDLTELEAELNLLQVQQRRADERDLPALLRRKEIVEANLDRGRAALTDEENASAALWKTIRDEEQAERFRVKTEEPLKLKADMLRAIDDFRAALAGMNPQANTITKGLARLRQIINSNVFGQFPMPPEVLASQAALREIYDALRALQLSFETSVGMK